MLQKYLIPCFVLSILLTGACTKKDMLRDPIQEVARRKGKALFSMDKSAELGDRVGYVTFHSPSFATEGIQKVFLTLEDPRGYVVAKAFRSGVKQAIDKTKKFSLVPDAKQADVMFRVVLDYVQFTKKKDKPVLLTMRSDVVAPSGVIVATHAFLDEGILYDSDVTTPAALSSLDLSSSVGKILVRHALKQNMRVVCIDRVRTVGKLANSHHLRAAQTLQWLRPMRTEERKKLQLLYGEEGVEKDAKAVEDFRSAKGASRPAFQARIGFVNIHDNGMGKNPRYHITNDAGMKIPLPNNRAYKSVLVKSKDLRRALVMYPPRARLEKSFGPIIRGAIKQGRLILIP